MTPTEAGKTRKETNGADIQAKKTDAEIIGKSEKGKGPQETAQEKKQKERTPAPANSQTRKGKRGSRKRRGTATPPTGTSQRAENDNAEEIQRLKQIKHAYQDPIPRRRKKTLIKNKTNKGNTPWADVGLIGGMLFVLGEFPSLNEPNAKIPTPDALKHVFEARKP